MHNFLQYGRLLVIVFLLLHIRIGPACAQDRAMMEIVPSIAHSGLVNRVGFSPDGTLALSNDQKTMKLWDAVTGALLRTFEAHSEAVAFSPVGNKLTRQREGYCGPSKTMERFLR